MDEASEACFIARDNTGQALAATLLTKDEARGGGELRQAGGIVAAATRCSRRCPAKIAADPFTEEA